MEVPKVQKTVFDHWMSLILISGKSLRITFKTHFNIKPVEIFSNLWEKPDDIAKASGFCKGVWEPVSWFFKEDI